MNTSRILESKGAQLERSLHSKRVTLSAADAELRRTEQTLTHRRAEFKDEVKRAVLRLTRKEEVSVNDAGKGGAKSYPIGDRKASTATSRTLPTGELFDPLLGLARLKLELVATEQRLQVQKAGVESAACEVGKAEQQLSAVQSMVGKLKTAAKTREENLSQEEVLSQAFSRHALSRQILAEHTSLSRRKSESSSGFDMGPFGMESAGGGQNGSMFDRTQIVAHAVRESSMRESPQRIEPMQVGFSTTSVDNTPSLSVKCQSLGGERIAVTVSGNVHESVKVELAVSDATLMPLLVREKGAILRRLKEAGHTIGDVSLVSGRGGSSSKNAVDSSGYRRRRGEDDELTVS